MFSHVLAPHHGRRTDPNQLRGVCACCAQAYALIGTDAMRLYHARWPPDPLLSFRVEMAPNGNHELARPFWIYGDLPKGTAEINTYDLGVLNWRWPPLPCHPMHACAAI